MDTFRNLSLIHPLAIFFVLGIAFGFVAHHAVFIHGEWHTKAPGLVSSHIYFFICLVFGTSLTHGSTFAVFTMLTALFSGYYPGLTLSIILYRIFFHRLTKAGIPGPWYARISKIWNVWAARTAQNHLVLAALHAKYGDVVRTGELLTYIPSVGLWLTTRNIHADIYIRSS